MDISISQIKKAIQKGVPLKFSTYTLTHTTMDKLDRILELFLEELGETRIKQQLSYCMKELAENGRKANLKRIYFETKNYNINNYNDYLNGIKTFKEDVYGNLPVYIEKLKEQKLYTRIIFFANSSFFTLSIRNNVPIMGYELKRVEERIAHSHAFKSMEEAFTSVMDQTEGAGLGIVILVLMLKKIGLSEDAFTIKKEGEGTLARITIPRSDILLENLAPLVEKMVAEIKELPQFPEHISSLQKLLSDPESEYSQIAKIVRTDPALTGDLLKLVNSALYMLKKKIQDIQEALKMVGFKGMKNLLYSYASQNIMDSKFGDMKKLWEHCYKTAFYGYHIAKKYNFKKILDDIYVSCLLHDLGKIIVEFLHPDMLDNIRAFTIDKGITADVFEKFAIGLHHAEIGGRIAEHWLFPDKLISAIRFHHEPERAGDEMKELVYTVYLANSLCNVEEASFTFEQMQPKVLSFLNLQEKSDFESLHTNIIQAFTNE